MHIPDGFLSPKTYLPAYGAAALLWTLALRRVGRSFDEETLPRLAVLTALAFALMLIMLPLPGGTSVHASGVAILAVTFGPLTCYLAISLVLLIQALFFGDGGVTTLPIGALALGFAGGSVAWIVWRLLRGVHEKTALFAAGWFGTVTAALLIALTLGAQPGLGHTADGTPLFFPFGLDVTLPAIVLPHMLLGIAEGLLTVLVCTLFGKLIKER
ncbi:MAG: cobalamin biosynthesis protein CbiM [bacterium]|nr:cobalamin biosynthesis protein CbiM [bacterium]